MVTHFIFLSSSYYLGIRIAMDYIVLDENIQLRIKNDLDKILKQCGRDTSISTHMIQAENKSWEAVCRADYFFKDVIVIKNLGTFIQLIKKDRTLEGIDVARYILSKLRCTHLKLQKLVYLCYAEYLCNTGKELFTDKIFAFKYGPVVDTVYQEYKEYGYKDIKDETEDIDNKNITEMPTRSRILFAEGGTEKVSSIDKTLEKYGGLTSTELVNITHRENTPWTITHKKMEIRYVQIKPEIIRKYHQYER